MIVHKCDRCGTEMQSWVIVAVDNGASGDESFVALALHGQRYEYCKSCYEALKRFASKPNNYQKGAALDV